MTERISFLFVVPFVFSIGCIGQEEYGMEGVIQVVEEATGQNVKDPILVYSVSQDAVLNGLLMSRDVIDFNEMYDLCVEDFPDEEFCSTYRSLAMLAPGVEAFEISDGLDKIGRPSDAGCSVVEFQMDLKTRAFLSPPSCG